MNVLNTVGYETGSKTFDKTKSINNSIERKTTKMPSKLIKSYV